jgi:hypothetical protein
MMSQQSTISHQHQQSLLSRPSSNHAHITPINHLQSTGLNMDFATMMPTDWQFQFQQAAAFQASTPPRVPHHHP